MTEPEYEKCYSVVVFKLKEQHAEGLEELKKSHATYGTPFDQDREIKFNEARAMIFLMDFILTEFPEATPEYRNQLFKKVLNSIQQKD